MQIDLGEHFGGFMDPALPREFVAAHSARLAQVQRDGDALAAALQRILSRGLTPETGSEARKALDGWEARIVFPAIGETDSRQPVDCLNYFSNWA